MMMRSTSSSRNLWIFLFLALALLLGSGCASETLEHVRRRRTQQLNDLNDIVPDRDANGRIPETPRPTKEPRPPPEPTPRPTERPTRAPTTREPTKAPSTKEPTREPTREPTSKPETSPPSPAPTSAATPRPTLRTYAPLTPEPTATPTRSPSPWPTMKITPAPTPEPTAKETTDTRTETESPLDDAEEEKEETDAPTEPEEEENEETGAPTEPQDEEVEEEEETNIPTMAPSSSPTTAPAKTYPPLFPSSSTTPVEEEDDEEETLSTEAPTQSILEIVQAVHNLPGVKEFTSQFSLWSSDGLTANDPDLERIKKGVITSLRSLYCEDPEVSMCVLKDIVLLKEGNADFPLMESRQELGDSASVDQTLLFPSVVRVGTVQAGDLTWTTWQVGWKVMQLGAPLIHQMVNDGRKSGTLLSPQQIHSLAPSYIRNGVSAALDESIEFGELNGFLRSEIQEREDVSSSVLGDEMKTFGALVGTGTNKLEEGSAEDGTDLVVMLVIVFCGSASAILAVYVACLIYKRRKAFQTRQVSNILSDVGRHGHQNPTSNNGLGNGLDGLSPTVNKPCEDSVSTAEMVDRDSSSSSSEYQPVLFPDLLDLENEAAAPNNDQTLLEMRSIATSSQNRDVASSTSAGDDMLSRAQTEDSLTVATYQRTPARFILAPDPPSSAAERSDDELTDAWMPTAGSVVAGSVESDESGVSSLEGWSVTSSTMNWT